MAASIKIHPEIIFAAKQKNLSLSGFRVWFIAKDFDHGNGNIPVKTFRKHLKSLGVNPKNITQWIDKAISADLIEKTGMVYRLASWEKAARISGCKKVFRGVKLPVSCLISNGWIAHSYSAFLIHFKNNPITRNTLYQITGVPPRTQYEYERKVGTPKIPNYAGFGSVADNPEVAISLSYQDGNYSKAGMIRRRLGNSYLPKDVQFAKKGRVKQVNKALRYNESSSQKPVFRLYCEKDEEVKKALRAIRRKGDYRNRPDFIFQFSVQIPKGAVWYAIPC